MRQKKEKKPGLDLRSWCREILLTGKEVKYLFNEKKLISYNYFKDSMFYYVNNVIIF